MADDIAEQLREYAREAETAADRAQEALNALEGGDAEKAVEIFGSTHEVDGYRKSILRALASGPPLPMPILVPRKPGSSFTDDLQ